MVFLMCDDNISQSLASRRPYSRDRRKKQVVTDGTFVMGVRPPKKTDKVFKNRLPRYDIPREVRELLEKKQIPNAVEEGLSIENYTDFFRNLVIMEEIQWEVTFYLQSKEQ